MWPTLTMSPPIATPSPYAERQWSADEALVELVRARLEGSGPITIDGLARTLGLATTAVHAALVTLEVEGFVLRGRFSPGALGEEWCERRLLARIHRYTLKRLRAEIAKDVATAYQQFAAATQIVEEYVKRILPGQEQAARLIREGYRQGEFRLTEALLAQRDLFEARSAYLEAIANYNATRTDLQRATGLRP